MYIFIYVYTHTSFSEHINQKSFTCHVFDRDRHENLKYLCKIVEILKHFCLFFWLFLGVFFSLYEVIRYASGRIFKTKAITFFAKNKYKIIKNALLLPEGLVTAAACCFFSLF